MKRDRTYTRLFVVAVAGLICGLAQLFGGESGLREGSPYWAQVMAGLSIGCALLVFVTLTAEVSYWAWGKVRRK